MLQFLVVLFPVPLNLRVQSCLTAAPIMAPEAAVRFCPMHRTQAGICLTEAPFMTSETQTLLLPVDWHVGSLPDGAAVRPHP